MRSEDESRAGPPRTYPMRRALRKRREARRGHNHRCRGPRSPHDDVRRRLRRKPPGGFGLAVHQFCSTWRAPTSLRAIQTCGRSSLPRTLRTCHARRDGGEGGRRAGRIEDFDGRGSPWLLFDALAERPTGEWRPIGLLAMTIQMVRTPLANRLPGIALHSPLSETGSMQSVSSSSSHFGHGRYSRVVPLRPVAGTMLHL